MIEFEKERSSVNYIYHQTDINLNFGTHIHNSYEFLYVYDGVIDATLNNIHFLVEKGNALFILPGQMHSYRTELFSKTYLCVFSYDYVEDFKALTEGVELKSPLFSFNKIDYLDNFRKTNSILLKKSFLLYVCNEALSHGTVQISEISNNHILYAITEYLNSNYKEDITMETMAEDLGFSYTYLSSYFHKFFGVNFKKFLNDYRIDYARKLLKETDMPISEVSSECGFATIRNFNRVFEKTLGCTPKCFKSAK